MASTEMYGNDHRAPQSIVAGAGLRTCPARGDVSVNATLLQPSWWTMLEPPIGFMDTDAAPVATAASQSVPVATDAGMQIAQVEEAAHEAEPCANVKVHDAVDGVSPPVLCTRRRLTGKQTVQDRGLEGLIVPPLSDVPSWKVRKKAAQHYAQEKMKWHCAEGNSYHERRAVLCREFKSLALEEQQPWLTRALSSVSDACEVGDAHASGANNASEIIKAADRGKPVAVLLTWNGQWLQDDAEIKTLFLQFHESATLLCGALASVPKVQLLMQEFWNCVAMAAIEHKLIHTSCALELSCSSVSSRRVHFHFFGSCSYGSEAIDTIALHNVLRFRAQKAGHCVACSPGNGRGSRARAIGQGHYYLQCLKEGVILAKTNYLKNKDWHVRQSWVLDLWRLRKLSHESARRELIACRERTQQALREIDSLEAAEYSQRTRDLLASARVIDRRMRFAAPGDAESAWLAQYEAKPDGCVLRRYKFLIYEGPSRSGKTERAIHWFSREKTLVVSAMNTTTPSLRSWLCGRYTAIVFDEGSWQLVSLNRQLFQAGLNGVTLSQSQCNEHTYELCLHSVPLMLTSNNFWKDCMDVEARQWIMANSFFVSLPEQNWSEA